MCMPISLYIIFSSEKSRCYTLMNADTFNDNPQENIVPNWLLPCTCGTKDAIVTLDLDPTIFALKGYHIKMNPHKYRPNDDPTIH